MELLLYYFSSLLIYFREPSSNLPTVRAFLLFTCYTYPIIQPLPSISFFSLLVTSFLVSYLVFTCIHTYPHTYSKRQDVHMRENTRFLPFSVWVTSLGIYYFSPSNARYGLHPYYVYSLIFSVRS